MGDDQQTLTSRSWKIFWPRITGCAHFDGVEAAQRCTFSDDTLARSLENRSQVEAVAARYDKADK